MKYTYLVIFSSLIFVLISASGGVGEAQNRERTGTPDGDNVCSQCHSSSTFNTVVNLSISDAFGSNVSLYTPGETYLLTFMVSETTGSPSEFGFQATALNNNLENSGVFTNPGSGVQIETVSNNNVTNRTTVEHSTPSSSGVFLVEWTAPQAEDIVTFYFSSIAANGNGSTSGDTYAGGTYTLYPDVIVPQVCPGDFNMDGSITATDLTSFLSVFGLSCD